METIQLLGEGTYRICYTTSNPNLCAKKVKSSIQKKYFGIKFNLNMEKYLKLKFGISDINKFEYKQIENLPKSLKKYIPSNVKLTEEGLIMDRPKDFTGEYSKNIIEFGKVRNEYFWKCVEEICALFKENNLWYYDVFYKGNNIVVKKVTTDKFVPIIVDIKAIGRKLNPLQINLILRSEQKRKFYRRFNKFKVKYYQKNNQPIKENYEKCI